MNQCKIHPVAVSRLPRRQGSALLLCTLAAVVLSMAGLAILQGHQRKIASVEAKISSVQGRLAKDSLLQSAIAQLKVDPSSKMILKDPDSGLKDAYCEIVPVSKTHSQIRIYLYHGSKSAAVDRTINTVALAGGKSK